LRALSLLWSNAAMRPKLWLLFPGTVFWALVFVALATGLAALWIAAAAVGVITATAFVTRR
jgi:hypothetical protein